MINLKKLNIVKLLISIFILFLLFIFSYSFKEGLANTVYKFLQIEKPCEKPITYSIGSFDSRFNLREEEVLSEIKEIEKIWEIPIGRDLFKYSPNGDLKINFIYDHRQKATDEMLKIGLIIDDNKDSYDVLRSKYDALIFSYNKEKKDFDSMVKSYNNRRDNYEEIVNYWNRKGGAPNKEYDLMVKEKSNLDNQVALIEEAEDSINKLVTTIYSVEVILNKLVNTLNLQVGNFNTINSSTGKEFSEGEYIRNSKETIINIYQFNNKNKFTRVLAHEFGHALGLDHIENTKSIMYYLNEGSNEELTKDDLSALENICGIN